MNDFVPAHVLFYIGLFKSQQYCSFQRLFVLVFIKANRIKFGSKAYAPETGKSLCRVVSIDSKYDVYINQAVFPVNE